MRILHISKYYYPYIGGVENICKYLVEAMPQHETAVVCFNEGSKDIVEDVEYYAKLSEIPSYTYEGSSVDLGSVCGKPFTVATLIINDPGDSTILEDLR